MATQYWLMKTEPDVFSIKDLQSEPKQTAHWDGVRNYQARNFMRDQMKVGDRVLFYHSRIDPSVAGTAKVVKAGYADHTAWDKKSKYYDPKSTRENPIWFMVDIQFESEFPAPLPLGELREVPEFPRVKVEERDPRIIGIADQARRPPDPDHMAVLVKVAFLQREGLDVILDMGLAPFLHPRQVIRVGEVEDGEFL